MPHLAYHHHFFISSYFLSTHQNSLQTLFFGSSSIPSPPKIPNVHTPHSTHHHDPPSRFPNTLSLKVTFLASKSQAKGLAIHPKGPEEMKGNGPTSNSHVMGGCDYQWLNGRSRGTNTGGRTLTWTEHHMIDDTYCDFNWKRKIK